jgi:hypothetical protein
MIIRRGTIYGIIHLHGYQQSTGGLSVTLTSQVVVYALAERAESGGQIDEFRPLTSTLGGRAWCAGTNM